MIAELSKRLQAVADLVTVSGCVADIGTDHAYIPIYLAGGQKIRRAFAMDVNEGPLERAREHVKEAGLEDRIELRLSNGLERLQPGEADAMIVAGMGGSLIIQILTEGQAVARQMKECILQPQSEIPKVRAYLLREGYRIAEEDMVLEDGKYYPMMRAIPMENGQTFEAWDEIELCYGKQLLKSRHPVLEQYLKREEQIKSRILDKLEEQSGEHITRRRAELQHDLACIRKGLKYYAV